MFAFKYKDYEFYWFIYSMTPAQYIKLIILLEKYKPNKICELGSGLSTRIFETYSNKNNTQYISIEDNKAYLMKNGIYMPTINSTEYIVNDYCLSDCMLYVGFELWLSTQDKFDFILIDGPNDVLPDNKYALEYSRVQLLSFVLLDKLCDNCIVLYHDCNNYCALKTLNKFEELLSDKGYIYETLIIEESDVEINQCSKDVMGKCSELAIYKINKNDSRTKNKEKESLGRTY